MITSQKELTVDSLKTRWYTVMQMEQQAASLQEQIRVSLDRLRADARDAGLAGELRQLEHPSPEAPYVRPDEPLVRVRALQSWSTEYFRCSYAAATGRVIDLPAGLARTLIRVGHVEAVDPATPLSA